MKNESKPLEREENSGENDAESGSEFEEDGEYDEKVEKKQQEQARSKSTVKQCYRSYEIGAWNENMGTGEFSQMLFQLLSEDPALLTRFFFE